MAVESVPTEEAVPPEDERKPEAVEEVVEDVHDIQEPPDEEEAEKAPGGKEEVVKEEVAGDETVPPSDADAEQLDPHLLEDAEAMGMSAEHARRLGAAGLLEGTLSLMAQPDAVAEPEETGPAEQVATKPAPEVPEGAFKFAWDEDEVPSELRSEVERMEAYYAARDKQRDAEIAEVNQRLEAETARKEIAWYDEAIADLGPEYEELLGKGPWGELNPDSAQFGHRKDVGKTMADIDHKFLGRGIDLPRKTVLRRALASEFPDVIATQARKEIAGNLETRKGGIVSRPTKRQASPEPKGDKLATTNLEQMYHEKGWDRGSPDDAGPDDFPE